MNMSIGTDYMLSRVAKIAGRRRISVALSFKLLLEKWLTFYQRKIPANPQATVNEMVDQTSG